MKLINIMKTYYNRNNVIEALKGINLEFNENGIIMILGSSGCGKTTLLNIMSGADKKFEGSIEDVPNFDYLTQEFNLLEEMSVLENLLIVKEDKELIDNYLKKFHLESHSKKKVKYLSNGQKKRVQFIRALLHKPGLLLCDEPTAALDHENAVMLMEELKTLSDNIQIILVTHDIALADKYADRIIRMDQGIVVSDEKSKNHNEYEHGEPIQKKRFNDTFKYVFLELKSRWSDTGLTVFLTTLSIVLLFALFSFYKDVSKQVSYNEAFEKGDNLIISLPYYSRSRTDFDNLASWYNYRVFYDIGDVFMADEIQNVIDTIPEIIAVESYLSNQYSNDNTYQEEVFEVFNLAKDPDPLTRNVIFANRPTVLPFMIHSSEYFEPDNLNDNLFLKNPYLDNMLNCYDLVNGAIIPLLTGEMPSKENEIVVSKNVADIIIKNQNYETYEELIGEKLLVGLEGSINAYYNDWRLSKDNVKFLDTLELTISGVSTIESKISKMIFFNNGYTNAPTLRHFVVNDEKLYFHYVRFLVEPGSDTEAIAEQIDEMIGKTTQDIIKYDGRGMEKPRVHYKNPANFFVYFVCVVVVFMLLFIIHYLFKKKRMNKENDIIHRYGYSIILERSIRIVLLTFISLLFALTLAYYACDKINELAKLYHYEMFIGYSPLLICITASIVLIYLFVIEIVMFNRIFKGVKK